MDFRYEKLTLANWEDFYTLFQKHKGVRGGCWCAYYLVRPKDFVFAEKDRHRELHYQHVKQFGSTGIIMYLDDLPVGYCQVAKYDVIERFDYSKGYNALPEAIRQERDWRISCLFVDKDQRKRGLASKLFQFALEHIAGNGGGWVEVFPFEYPGMPDKFQFNGSVAFYRKNGFEMSGKIGKSEVLMRKYIAKA